MFRFTQNTMVCAPSSSTRTCSFWLWYAHARRCCCYCRWSRARARPQALTRAMLAALLQLVLACGLSAMIGAQLALAKYVPLAPPGMGAQGGEHDPFQGEGEAKLTCYYCPNPLIRTLYY